MDRRSLIRFATLLIALLSSLWALVLAFSGGFDWHFIGLSLTTHDPTRLMWVAIAAWIAFALLNGVQRTMRVDHRIAIAVLTIATFAVCARFRLVAVGGSDSYGYASAADALASGSLTMKQTWVKDVPWEGALDTFTPLGWRRGLADDELAPKYPAGLPILLAAAKLVAGHCAMFYVGPLAGALLVLSTYGLGRRLQSPRVGVLAAWLMATSPIALYMAVQPMSDVPAAALWTGALYFVFGASLWAPLASGTLAGIAILTRPNLAPLAAVLGVWFVIDFVRTPSGRGRVFARALVFGAACGTGVAALLILNAKMYGSPLASSYGDVTGFYAVDRVWANLSRYAAWMAHTETPIVFLGLIALAVPTRRLWIGADRAIVVTFTLFTFGVIASYAVFLTFDAWWFLRFLLPAFPPILIGLVVLGRAIARTSRVAAIAVVAVIAAVGIRGLFVARQDAAFDIWREGEKYASVGRLVRGLTERNAVIFSMQHSGSLRYYGGRLTLMYPMLRRDAIDSTVQWLTDRGVHAYALLEEWEVPDFEQRFAGQGTMTRLREVPVLKYTGPATVLLFDLQPRAPNAPTVEHEEDYAHADCEPSARPPRLTFAAR